MLNNMFFGSRSVNVPQKYKKIQKLANFRAGICKICTYPAIFVPLQPKKCHCYEKKYHYCGNFSRVFCDCCYYGQLQRNEDNHQRKPILSAWRYVRSHSNQNYRDIRRDAQVLVRVHVFHIFFYLNYYLMKSIEFIAPVESMRGNLSGKQDLVYAENENKAYESPANQRNYALNYSPRFIGAKRSADGRKYFAVKTKTATTITATSKRAMAVMGGCGAITGAILLSSTIKAACQAQMSVEKELGYNWKSLRQFLSAKIRPALESKAAEIVIAPIGGVINNPWVDGGTGVSLQIANTTLVRFWSELANNPYEFKVSSLTAVAHANETFGDVTASRHNVLSLFKVPQGDDLNCIKLDNQFVVEHIEVEGEIVAYQVMADTNATSSNKYYLSDTKGEVRA